MITYVALYGRHEFNMIWLVKLVGVAKHRTDMASEMRLVFPHTARAHCVGLWHKG